MTDSDYNKFKRVTNKRIRHFWLGYMITVLCMVC